MADPYVIKMPQLSDTMTEGVIVSWEKNIGDAVKRGDIVATVETDKAVMDVEVFRDGFLSGPLAPVDSVVPVTHAIAYLVESESDVDASAAAMNRRPPRRLLRLRSRLLRLRPRPRVRRVWPRRHRRRVRRGRRPVKPRRWRESLPRSRAWISTGSAVPLRAVSSRRPT